jgi:hypothetical protein
MQTRWAGLIAGMAMLLVMPGAASAATVNNGSVDGVTYLSSDGSDFVTNAAPLVIEIPCPGTKRPMGGGYSIGLNELDTLRSAAPADLNGDGRIDGWRVVAETGQSSTGVGTDASAICRKGTVKYVTKTGTLPASPGALTLTARCPKDMHVTGGGAVASNGGAARAAYVSSMYPIDGPDADSKPDDGWRATFYGSTQPGTKVIAICASTKQTYAARSTQHPEQDNKIPAGTVGSGYWARCPATKHVLGIGAYIGGPPGHVRVHSIYTGDAFDGDPNADADTVPDDDAFMSFSNRSSSAQPTEGWAICG